MKQFKTPDEMAVYAHSFDDKEDDCNIIVCASWGEHIIQSVPRTCCVCRKLVALDVGNVPNSEKLDALISCIDCMNESGLLSKGNATTQSMIGGKIMSVEEGIALFRAISRIEKAQEN